MSADGNESPGFLNRAVPLGLYAVLVVFGFYMLVNDGPPLVLAMLAVIAATLTYIFLAKPLRGGPEGKGSLLSPEGPGDLTKTIEIGARMDQIVADIEQLRQREGGADVTALKRDVLARIEQLAAEIQEVKQETGSIDTADITQAMNARFEHVLAEIEELKQSGGSVDAGELRQELETRLAQVAAQVQDVQQVGGGVDTEDIRREMDARLDTLRTEIEDLRERGGVADVEGIKEQLATLQVYQTSSLLSEKDRIDRISGKLNVLQRMPDEVAKLKENQRLSETERHKIAAAGKDLEEQLAALQMRLDETASVDRVQGWMGELREDMESIENQLKDAAQAPDLKALSEELVPQMHSLQKLVIELQDPSKIKELAADIEKIKERIPALAAANDVEMLAEHVKQQVRELNGIIDETDQTEAVQQLRAKLTEEVAGLRTELEKGATAEDVEEAIDAVKTQMAEISARLDGVTAKELEERFANLKNEVRKVKETLSAAPKTQDVQKLVSEVRAEASKEAQQVADRLTAASEARGALSDEMSELQDGLANLREKTQEIAELRTRLDEAATVEHVTESLGELRETIGTLENRLAESVPVEDLKALREELTPQIRVLQKAVGEMQDPRKLNDVAAEVEEIREQLAEFAGTSDLEAATKEVRQQISELAQSVKDTDQTQAVREIDAKTNQRLEQLKKQLAATAKRPEVEEATSAIKEQIADLEQTIADVQKALGDAARAPDLTALRDEVTSQVDSLQKTLTDLEDATKLDDVAAEVKGLREQAAAFASSDEVEVSVKKLERQVAELRQALEEADQAQAVEELRARVDRDLKTVKAQLQSAAGQAEVKDAQARLSELNAAVEGIKEQLAAVPDSSEVEATATEVKQQIAELRKILDETDQAQPVLDLQTQVRKEIDDLQKKLESRPAAEDLEKVAQDIRAQVAELRQALEEADQEQAVEELRAKVNRDLKTVKAQLQSAAGQAEVKESQARLSELNATVEGIKEQLAAVADSSEVEATATEVKQQIAELRKILGETDQAQAVLDLQTRVRKEIDELQKQLESRPAAEDLEKTAEDIRAQVAELRQALEEADQEQAVEELRARVNRDLKTVKAQLQSAAGQAEVQEAQARLSELNATVEGIKEQLAAVADSSEVEATAAEVKQQIAELRKILGETDQAQAVLDLQTRVRTEIDDLQKQLESRPAAEDMEKAAEDIRAQVAELSSRVDRLAEEEIEERVSAITKEVKGLKEQIASAPGREEVEDLAGSVREQTAALAARVEGMAVSELRDQLSDLDAQVSRLGESVSAALTQKDLQAAIDGIREDISARVDDLNLGDYETGLAELKSEIEGLKEALPLSAADEDLRKLVDDTRAEVADELKRMEEALSAKPGAPVEVPPDIEELRDRVSELSGLSTEVSQLWERLAELKWGIKPEGEAETSPTEELEHVVAGLRQEVDALSARPGGGGAEVPEEHLAQLRSEIETLMSGMESIRETVGQLEAQLSPEELRAEMDGIRNQFEELTSRAEGPAAEELEQRLAEVRGELDKVKEGLSAAPSDTEVQEVASRVRTEVAERLTKLEDDLREEHEAQEDVSRSITELRDKMENVGEAAEEIASVRQRLGELASIDKVQQWIADIHTSLSELEDRLAQTATASNVDALRGELEPHIESLKQAIDELRDPDALDRLTAEIDSIKEQLSAFASASDIEGVTEDMRKQVDELKEMTSEVDVRQTIEELREQFSERLDGLSQRVEAPAGADEVAALAEEAKEQIAELSARVDQLAEEDLKTQIGELSDEIGKLREVASAAGTEKAEGLIEEIRTGLSEQIKAVEDRLSAEAGAREETSSNVAEVRESLLAISATLAQIDMLSARMAVLENTAPWADALAASKAEIDEVVDQVKSQIAEVSASLEGAGANVLAELRSDLDIAKQSLVSATGSEEVQQLPEGMRTEVTDRLSEIQEALSAESDAREQLSQDVAGLRKKLETVGQATAEIDQLWERLAEMKWGLTPTGPAEAPSGTDGVLDGIRAEIAEMASRLDGLDTEEAEKRFAELREEIDRLKQSASAMPKGVPPLDVVPRAAPGPAFRPGIPRQAGLSEGITEVTSLRQIGTPGKPEAQDIGAAQQSYRETKGVALPAEEETTAKVFHISDPSVQSLAATYSSLIASLDRGLAAIRDGEQDFDLEGIWREAKELSAAMEEHARILVSLTARPYQGESRISNHSVNVLLLTLRVSELAPISPDERASLGKAALFHDIGMMRLPQELLTGGRQASDTDQEELRRYPEYSAQLLQPLGDELVCALVLQAHEREDGSGFPSGLTGPEIHPLAKLLHVADVFDALIHAQGQSRPQPFEAIKMLQSNVKTSLNAEAFDQFREALGAFPVGTIVELNTRERAKVIAVKPREMLRPAVAVLTDPDGNHLPESRFLDLQRSTELSVARALVDEKLAARARDLL